ncbi:LuxR C-terminal-related transcriptional regulator [Nonomuraea sp. NPDC048892]|uniref:helix-turn-helix transcriptional regulator n=1 Tax=Nonomuraea sp. NPDC048892 TaxID=3154624 RepID=UPI0033E46501
MARPPRRTGNLPAEATSFVGRRRELAVIRRKLSESRLVSLVGPGGVGKTRLALRMAGDLGRGFPGGAWLVELAEVGDPGLVGDAVTAALDLRTQTAAEPVALLLSYLRDKRLLLVVDNCEHLLGAVAPLVAEVMRAAPGVRVIATSREPLSVPGEHVVPVPPLDLPPPARAPLAELRRNEAVSLFAERAAAGSGTFELTPANQAAVADLCRRLDGLPLAIELAAVRTRVLSAEQILERLDDRFGLLTGGSRAALPRHQTLRTTVDWSHDLLAAGERALLRRLCAFAGRFTLEDVTAICAYGDVSAAGTLDLMASLVDKSLVIKEDAGGLACYRLHETMREYAVLKLRAAGEEEFLARRRNDHYIGRCLESAPRVRQRLGEWLAWMDLEIDNVRHVLRDCVTRGDLRVGVLLVYSLGYYWMTRGLGEGVRWLDELLAYGGGGARESGLGPQELALAWYMRGFLAVLQSDPATARPALDRAVDAAGTTAGADRAGGAAGMRSVLAQSLSLTSMAAAMAGDRPAAARLGERAQAATEGLGDHTALLMYLQSRALTGLLGGDLATAGSAAEEGVRLGRETGDLYSLGMMLLNLGATRLIAGALDEAGPLLAEGLRVAYRIDDRVGQYALLYALACHAAGTGRARPAARLLGAAETVRAGTGADVLPYLAPLLVEAGRSAQAALGEPGFDEEFATGAALDRDAAVALALGEPAPGAAQEPSDEGAPPLGRRESEVARLVAEGLSNKQIGARLFISEHTVDSHVRAIMNKLGFNSRAQIAAWTATERS